MNRIVTVAALSLPLLTVACPLRAQECPAPMKQCKVLFLSPEEEQALTGQNMIFQTAEQARYLDLSPVVKYLRDKIAAAPAGTAKAEPAPQPAPKK